MLFHLSFISILMANHKLREILFPPRIKTNKWLKKDFISGVLIQNFLLILGQLTFVISSKFFRFILLYVCERVFCLCESIVCVRTCVCARYMSGVPLEARKSPKTGVTNCCESLWVLGNEPRSSARQPALLTSKPLSL